MKTDPKPKQEERGKSFGKRSIELMRRKEAEQKKIIGGFGCISWG